MMVLGILAVVGVEGVYYVLAVLCVCYGFVCGIRFFKVFGVVCVKHIFGHGS